MVETLKKKAANGAVVIDASVVLGRVDESERREITRHALRRFYATGARLFEHREIPAGIFIIDRGRVALLTSGDRVLTIAQADEMIGFDAHALGHANGVTAEALEPTSVRFIPRHSLAELLESPTLREAFLEALQISAEAPAARKDLTTILQLAAFLRGMGALATSSHPHQRPMRLELTPHEIAGLVGVSDAELHRAVHELERAHTIRITSRSVKVFNPRALELFAKAADSVHIAA